MANLLLGSAFLVDEVCSFHLGLARQAEGVMLEEDFYLGIGEHTLLHDFRCAEIGFAHNHIDLFAEPCEIGCFLAGSISATHYGDGLVAIEEAVACGARRHTASFVLLLGRDAKKLGTGARGDDDRLGIHLFAVFQPYLLGGGAEIHFRYDPLDKLCAEALCLAAEVVHHLERCHALGVAREILYFGGDHQLPAHLGTIDEDGG